jgi:hypothetical protein
MYKPGGTIKAALDRIQKKEYVLPAIQREFVWKPEQIERLFDSLMQGYPFGTFLFWKVSPQMSGKFKFYDFVLNYHQRDAAHCPELPILHNQGVTAVLDGQQRLTALNIGLRGSMAVKQPHKWWNNPDAFPKRVLSLNLLAPDDIDEDGVRYEFKFLTSDQNSRTESELWYPVPRILGISEMADLFNWVIDAALSPEAQKRANRILGRLFQVIHSDNLIHYYEEENQDLERVLNIFIRLNSGGTVLSYSDLLLSIAVAQWKERDARTEIHGLVDELNDIGTGFDLSQDFVLKAGLMLSDIASVGFKVENFTGENMAKLEAQWPAVRAALVRTVELVASFGFNGRTLRADSALLPIAYYLFRRNVPANYVTHSSFHADREAIRLWLVRSLLKASGIWGSGLDTLLTALREKIRTEGTEGFPMAALGHEMDARGKSLNFTEAEVEDLLSMPYGDRRLFALLSILFPFIDLRNQFHIDHVFPKSLFGKTKLRKLGLENEHELLDAMVNGLPNLQLLDGAANIEKQAALPADWISKAFPDAVARKAYADRHLLGDLPRSVQEFKVFHAERRAALAKKLAMLLDGA